jgi:preprotein translocase subunit SecA
MEDDLMRLFGGERLKNLMQRLGMREGEEIEHSLISRAIANAQKRVEGRNFEIRKHLLKYDEVMNEQRSYIYTLRNRILDREDISDIVHKMIDNTIDAHIDEYSANGRDFTAETVESMKRWVEGEMRIPVDSSQDTNMERISQDSFSESLKAAFHSIYEAREKQMGTANMRTLEKLVLLDTIDSRWKDHLYEMDGLKEGINWMAYAERDPLTEYKLRGMTIFNTMLASVHNQATSVLFRAELSVSAAPPPEFNQYAQGQARHDEFGMFSAAHAQAQQAMLARQRAQQQAAMEAGGGRPARAQQIVRTAAKVGRNDPCPCGSGRKYKQCHGKGE